MEKEQWQQLKEKGLVPEDLEQTAEGDFTSDREGCR